MHALTEHQLAFAEEHHGAVYSFLRLQGVDFDDFYDIAIFGFLEAVQRYCEDVVLASKCSFSTIAYRKMFDKIYRARGKEYRRRRLIGGDPVSFQSSIHDTEGLRLEDVIPSRDPCVYERVEAAAVCWDVFEVVTPLQLATANMLAEGFSVKDTAKFFGVSSTAISGRMRTLRGSVNKKGGWDIPEGRRPRIEEGRSHYKKMK
jgi:RNA polymerase sigma-70 factor (ECF subfamily)